MQSWDLARSTLRQLRLMGVRVALDDFGTGYSSFSYLLRLPVDIVKLDGSFVARLANDVQDRTIVESVVTLARRLGMQVVAEGVEDEHQRIVLERLGCHIVQGFGLGRPGDVQSCSAWCGSAPAKRADAQADAGPSAASTASSRRAEQPAMLTAMPWHRERVSVSLRGRNP